jgi:hypothetical protein
MTRLPPFGRFRTMMLFIKIEKFQQKSHFLWGYKCKYAPTLPEPGVFPAIYAQLGLRRA